MTTTQLPSAARSRAFRHARSLLGAFAAVLLAALAPPAPAAPAPLLEGLGHHHHPVTTRSKLGQRFFDQGWILLYNFNYAEAIRAFEALAALDPECAMAHWGIAFAHGPHVNAPMEDSAVPKAWAALQKAIALKPRASAREQEYIDALARRYQPTPTTNRAALDEAFADAMRLLVQRHPTDLDAQVLFAEALMDMSPWNYWQEDKTMKPTAKEALEAIEFVLKRARRHPGANHLHIHLVEAGPNPEQAERSADSLAKFAPAAGHLVHMPSHIYVRVGRYHDASTANELASKADEIYLAQCRQQGMYPGGYYPHNLHFLWYALGLEGRSANSIAAARKLSAYALDLRCGAIEGPRQRYLPQLAWARFGRWDDILREPAPATNYPYDRAMAHYARALARCAQGSADEAEQEYAAFQALERSDAVKGMDNPYFPGTKMLAVANRVLAGKIAAARGRHDEAVARFEEAVKAEGELSYMEPPYWYYAARLTLGAALLQAGKPAEAERVFRESLKELPENGWPLFGLEASLRAQDKKAEADKARRRFDKAWQHADTQLELAWF
jgi:hypothetical protein